MDAIWDWGISLIMFFQSLGTWLEGPMKFFSFLGQEEFYLIVAPSIYWCLDTTIGIRLALWLVISGNLNMGLKLLFADTRPYWYSTDVTAYANETSFGLPSGHAQNAVVIFGGMGYLFKRRWTLWAGAIIAVLIGLSRLYLAVHFPSDVLLGWLIGLALLLSLLHFEPNILGWVRQQSLAINILMSFVGALVLIAIVYLPSLLLASWTIPQSWQSTAAVTSPEGLINPLNISGAYSNAGAFFGLAVGALWIAKDPLQTKGIPIWKLAIRYVVGILGVMAFWKGLDMLPIFSGDVTSFDMIMRFTRYALTGFWISGLGPVVFKKLEI
jgi:membrane-associated phospholipid phosphatase